MDWDWLKDEAGYHERREQHGEWLQLAHLALAGKALAEAVRLQREEAPLTDISDYPCEFSAAVAAALSAWDALDPPEKTDDH